jgi:hypothetical protein
MKGKTLEKEGRMAAPGGRNPLASTNLHAGLGKTPNRQRKTARAKS